MSIILIPTDTDTADLTRAEIVELEVPDSDIEEQYREWLDGIHGPATIAGLEYDTSRALEVLDPIAYRCGFADYVSEYFVEVDPDGFNATVEPPAGCFAECPDHGSRMWWHEARRLFYCPADERGRPQHPAGEGVLAPADIYLEHNEAWRVVDGCLWVGERHLTPTNG